MQFPPSGNRTEGRISPHIQANYLASPPLVVAYAWLGTWVLIYIKTHLEKIKVEKNIYERYLANEKEIEEIFNISECRDVC